MKYYLSNIRPAWPFERQEALLDDQDAGWRDEAVYRDILPASKRKSHGSSDLEQRAMMLRPSSRADGGTIVVASLAVLDWTVKGFLGVLDALTANNATLLSLDCMTRIPPQNVAAAVVAVTEFERAVKRSGDARKSGGMVSGERRKARADAACEAARSYWGLPTADYSTQWIQQKFAVSRPKLIDYLGPRGDAQRAHRKAIETAERNRARGERRKQHAAE